MKLTLEQQKAITTPKSLAVIASAGTGKTTVLANRYLDLIQNRAAAVHTILAFTFTEKAAREMQTRILASGAVKPDEMSEASISTIHAFLAKLFKRHGHHVGLENDFEIMNEHAHKLMLDYEVRKFIDESLAAKDKAVTGFLKFYGPFQLDHTITELLKLDVGSLSEAECAILNPTEEINSETNKTKEVLSNFMLSCRGFAQKLAAERLKKKLLIYADLETLALKLFDENPQIALSLAKRYRHVLVDEFQDIAPREFRLIAHLFHPELNELFIVGDPKQAIYGFREADADLFRAILKKIEAASGEVIYLTETFRTPKALTTLFNDGFSQLFSHDIYKPAVSHKDDPNARVEIITAPQTDENEEMSKHDLFADNVVTKIKELIATGVAPRDIALIANARTAMPAYAKKLAALNIAVNFAENTGALNHPVTALLWHVLMYLTGDRNRITQAGIVRSPLFNFSENFIDHLLKTDGKDLFFGQTLDLFAATKEKEKFTALCVSLKQEMGLASLLTPVELTKTVMAHLFSTPSAIDKAVCDRFVTLIESWQAAGATTLALLRPMLARLKNEDFDLSLVETRDNAVSLLTVHGAKGLEFDHVFILPGTRPRPNIAAFIHKKGEGFVFKAHDCDKERTLKYKLEEPASFTTIKDSLFVLTRDEVRRLVYVSLTRARRCLYFVVDPASKELREKLAKNPDDVSTLKSYNDHLYWFSETKAKLHLTEAGHPQLTIPLDDASENKTTSLDWSPVATATPSLPVISVTQIETFFFCPKKYQMLYGDRVRPVNMALPNFEANQKSAPTKISSRERGNFFHEVLQFYDYKREQNLDTVIDQALFNQHLNDAGGALRTEAHLLVTKLKNNRVTENILFAGEESREETKFSLKFKSFVLAGQIDKIVCTRDDQGRERWLVVDFKTHHAVTSEDRDRLMDEFSFQLACYALATAKSLGLKELETMVLFTNGPDFRVIKHTPESLAACEVSLENIFADYLTKSVNNHFPLTTHRNLCARCAFYAGNYCGVRTTP